MRTTPSPPRAALALLERLLDPRVRDTVIGDLVESHATAPSSARFWLETVAAVWHFHAPLHFPEADMASLVSSFAADLRLGARVLRRAPAFTTVCVATLALAIGPTAAILSVADPLIIRPLPYASPDRVAFLWERDRNGGHITTGFATFDDIRRQTTTLSSLAAVAGWQTTLSSPTSPERLDGASVTASYFSTLGVPVAIGRDFTAGDDQPDHTNVVILTHGLWVRRFGGDRAVLGRTIDLDGAPMTVIGVLPASYDDMIFPQSQLYKPLGYLPTQPWACRSCRHLHAVARIADGVTRERALAELNAISAQLVRAYPHEYRSAGMFLTPLQETATSDVRPALFAILGAVGLVLLIAAANVVNLQLARAVRREGEFAVRIALGAAQTRLAQQLVAEGLIIALAGGGLGLALGRWTLPVLVAHLPQNTPRLASIHLDGDVLAAIAAVIVTLAIVLGLIPALGARRRAIFSGALRGAARVGAVAHHRLRAGLVVAEVALALLLLAGAGLLARSLDRLLAVHPGFDARNLVTMQLEASGRRYPSFPGRAIYDYRERQMAAARAVPGVTSVAVSTVVPLGGSIDRFGMIAQDVPLANPALAPLAEGYRVMGDFFKTMGIRILAGRDFDAEDMRDSAAPVAIVSQALAQSLWGADAVTGSRVQQIIGRRIQVPNARAKWSTVVGVAANVRHYGLDADDTREFYVPEPDWSWAATETQLVAHVRDESDAGAVLQQVRKAVGAVDPSQPITGVRTMQAVVSASTAQRSLALTLFAAFALLAVLLAAAGIYGVLSGAVAERTREIGLRSALGASPAALLQLVLRRGLALTLLGVVLGAAGALALTRYLGALLFGVAATDPATFAAAALVLVTVAIAACLVPARRAVRIDPMTALRE